MTETRKVETMTDEPKPATDEEREARRALQALFLEVPMDVAADVKHKVLAWMEADRGRIAELEEQLSGKTFFCAKCEQRQRRIAELEEQIRQAAIEERNRDAEWRKRIAELEAMLRETLTYALGSDCSTKALLERARRLLRR